MGQTSGQKNKVPAKEQEPTGSVFNHAKVIQTTEFRKSGVSLLILAFKPQTCKTIIHITLLCYGALITKTRTTSQLY